MVAHEECVSSSQSLSLDLPPSCIELCQKHPCYFVVGTYNLQTDEATPTGPEDGDERPHDENIPTKSLQSRNGTLVVYKTSNGIVSQTQIVSQPSAILDLHFCPLEGLENILAVVSSTGTLAIFELDPSADEPLPLKHIATSSPLDIPEGVLFLSVAWHPSDAKYLAVTLSTGEVRLLRLNEDWKVEGGRDESVISHSLEAWTVAFSPQMAGCNRAASELTIYSGGDDSTLRYASLGSAQTLEHEPDLQTLYPPLKLDGHGAGVTAILPTTCRLADGSNVVITGSYDDCVRVFAIKAPQSTFGARKTQKLTEMNLGGGVWRLKLVHATEYSGRWEGTILASCMHAGARVIRITGSLEGSEWDVSILVRFEEHQSMNYGSEVIPGGAGETLTCLSTSFYDRLLCMWEAPLS